MEESVLLSLKGPGLKRNPGVRSGRCGKERRSQQRGPRTGQSGGTRDGSFAAGRAAARMAPTRRGSKLITRSGGSFAVGRKVRGSRRTQGIPEERGCAGRDARRRFRTQGRQAAASLGNDAAQDLGDFCGLPPASARGKGHRRAFFAGQPERGRLFSAVFPSARPGGDDAAIDEAAQVPVLVAHEHVS